MNHVLIPSSERVRYIPSIPVAIVRESHIRFPFESPPIDEASSMVLLGARCYQGKIPFGKLIPSHTTKTK
jgi:hypothetical protein